MTDVMQGFPAAPDTQVTLANWRVPPFNRWAFHHVREIIPTAEIPNDPNRVAAWTSAPADVSEWTVATAGGGSVPFERFLADSYTDGIVIAHRGRIVVERYAPGMTAATPHILMSVSKSMLAIVAGILAARGEFLPETRLVDILPELGATAYAEATVRHLLDMRVGIRFDEDYSVTSGPIVEYRKSTGWNPLAPGDVPSDLRAFYRCLIERDGPHGGRFHYVSPNTDLLGWAMERATGRRFADLASELLWGPAGAAHAAYITVDRLGAPRCAGGMCVAARDLARIGQLLVDGGARDGRQVVPEAWIDDLVRGGDRAAWDAGSFVDLLPGRPIHYRSKWYVENGASPLLFGIGIHGQHLFVDRARELVIAKLSSQPVPLDAADIAATMRAVDALRRLFG